MESIFWNVLNYDNFNLFIRDLSSSMNTNLKYMIEDLDRENPTKVTKKHKKKADIIIEAQNKKREAELVVKDKKTICFLIDNLNKKDPYVGFDKLKTEEAKIEYKFMLLHKYYKKSKYLNHTLNLYYNLKDETNINESNQKIINMIRTKLEDYDCKLFMFEKLGHLLPPLNFWDKGELKLDPWQEEIILKIKNNKSILVRAPTSSGKTFISISAGIYHNKVLYVCPAEPVAYQIGANFTKMNYKVHYLVDNHAHLSHSNKTTIYIGTPDIIEKYIYKIGVDFDYVVYDEIHNLTPSYKNIIHLLNCNFIALSATIQNSDELLSQLSTIHPSKKIDYFEYNKRFINQQRWIWTDSCKLKKLHPCICLDTDNFKSFKEISFTPNDLACLYEKMEEVFQNTEMEDEVDKYSLDNYFKKDSLLTLDDSKEYETFIKLKLEELHQTYPEKIKLILSEFTENYQINEQNTDFLELFDHCKNKDLLPMILFHTNEKSIKDIFTLIDTTLREKEASEYPYYQEILTKKNEHYIEYSTKRKIYESNIKIKTKDPHTEKKEKMEVYDNNEKDKYIRNITDCYDKYIAKCKKNDNSKNQIVNLKKEKSEFISNPDFRSQDIYKKHHQFCFTNYEPMSGTEIKTIRREIIKTAGIKIEYTDPLFQLLKRGIGIYIKRNPPEYNWIIQRLMSQKKLAIILSDKTLCLGIDLPIRTSCFTGYDNPNFTKEDYLQMSGRAGRRGQDNQGNIIFHNISNYKELMQGVLPVLDISQNPVSENYRVLPKLNSKIKIDMLPIQDNTVEVTNNQYKLLWYLKDFKNSVKFVNSLDGYEKKLFHSKKEDREYEIFSFLCTNLLDSNDKESLKLYQNKMKGDSFINLLKIGNICKDICNSVHPIKYKFLYENCKKIFDTIRSMI